LTGSPTEEPVAGIVERLRAGRSLEHGTVTFLFTDIEGSTRLLEELGDEYADVLADHRLTLREEFARHSGVEVGTEGDSFL
jgi:class 3 adenylate cyclase